MEFESLNFNYVNEMQRSKLIITYIGRDDDIKGLEGFISELNSISRSLSFSITLNLVGSFLESNVERYKNLSKSFDLKYLGPIFGSKKYDLLSRSSCLVVPSKYESFCISALESLSVGRPVLMSDKVGISRDLDKSDYCFVYELNSSSSLKENIIMLFERQFDETSFKQLEDDLDQFSSSSIQIKLNELLNEF
ncbi:glycosyltransferase [Marinobacterium sp. xm-d-564]|uniref:glycosyltransferase n=1 Tax=Marinobacterium sp. xm-d-564 TaxID=2497742 RepID=UPI001569F390